MKNINKTIQSEHFKLVLIISLILKENIIIMLLIMIIILNWSRFLLFLFLFGDLAKNAINELPLNFEKLVIGIWNSPKSLTANTNIIEPKNSILMNK